MQLTIRTKFIYGFLILALGMMLTDVCRLVRASSGGALTVASSAPQVRKY